MNNEIKEILDLLKGIVNEKYAMPSEQELLNEKEIKILVDYITNLQEQRNQFASTINELGKSNVNLQTKITNLQEENQRLKKKLDCKERFSKIMPEDTEFIILSKADYDRQQEDIELVAIELRNRIDKAIKVLKHHDHEFEGTLHSALNILQGDDKSE